MSGSINIGAKQVVVPNGSVSWGLGDAWDAIWGNKPKPVEQEKCNTGQYSDQLSLEQADKLADIFLKNRDINITITQAGMISNYDYSKSEKKLTKDEKLKLDDGLSGMKASFAKIKFATQTSKKRCDDLSGIVELTNYFNALSKDTYKIGKRLGWKFKAFDLKPIQFPTTLS
jgi:hypothetical protein